MVINQLINNSKAGDKVKVGNCEWRKLDIKNNEALLMKNNSMAGRAYNDEFGDVTWEKSTLRQWLNTEFLNKTFSEAERKNIILSNIANNDNPIYGTDGGNDTKDYTFLLSINEVNTYNSLFPTFKSFSWLRSPGNSQSSAAFLSVNGSAMDYGYVATNEEIKVRPVMWFNMN